MIVFYNEMNVVWKMLISIVCIHLNRYIERARTKMNPSLRRLNVKFSVFDLFKTLGLVYTAD